MGDLLTEIVENKRREVIERKRLAGQSSSTVSTRARSDGITGNPNQLGKFAQALSGDGIRIVAEVKPKSPSAGKLSQNNLDEVFDAYGKHAHALSVLTDQKYFAGNLALLHTAAERTGLPVLCKDFFIDEFQIGEARESGADAVLLIVKILEDETLVHLHQLTLELGMTPVVEVQNVKELNRAIALSPQVILINNRDLSTFEINFDTTKRLSARIPSDVICVSASGIEKRADIDALMPYAQRFLIGSSVMRSADPAAKLQELLGT